MYVRVCILNLFFTWHMARASKTKTKVAGVGVGVGVGVWCIDFNLVSFVAAC